MKKSKRIISICIMICIMLGTMSPMNNFISAQAKQSDVESVIDSLAHMYKNDTEYRTELENNPEESVCVADRIIVSNGAPLSETYDSVSSAYIYGSNYIQYKNEADAKYAFEQFYNSGYEPYYDSVFKSENAENQDVVKQTSVNSVKSSSITAYTDSFNTMSVDSESDVNTALDYYKNKIKSQIVVAVLDTGIQYSLDVFKDRVIRTYMDFSSDASNDELETRPILKEHGTLVSSVIVSCTPSNVKIKHYKIADKNGNMYVSSIELALSYINEANDKPDIINMSFSGENKGLNVLVNKEEELINDLNNAGVTMVSSLGNTGGEISYAVSPGGYDNVIAVAGTTSKGVPHDKSSYSCITDIAAPYNVYTYGYNYINNELKQSLFDVSGTSFSSPIVASAAALILMEHKDYTPAQVRQCLYDTAIPFRKGDCNKQYGIGVVNFTNIIEGSRYANVTSNYTSGVYKDDINVELKCSNSLSLVDIIYTTDGSLPTKENGTVYKNPIKVTEDTRIIAAAYPRIGSKLHSKFLSLDYYIHKNGESDYKIDADGTILAYLGSEKDLVIPDKIDGITPESIGKQCFKFSDINSIVLPDSVTLLSEYAFANTPLSSIVANGVEGIKHSCFKRTKIKEVYFPEALKIYDEAFFETPIEKADLPKVRYLSKAFYKCDKLNYVNIPNIATIQRMAFYDCYNCNIDLIAPNLSSVTQKGLAHSGFKKIIADKLNSVVAPWIFDGAKAELIKLGSLKQITPGMFRNCENLKSLYLPNAVNVGTDSACDGYENNYPFLNCKNLSFLFIPKCKNLALNIENNLKVYAGKDFSYSVDLNSVETAPYKYTIITVSDSNAVNSAKNDKFGCSEIVSADDYVNALGAQIRVNNVGMRFGFSWDRLDELEDMATTVNYGFLITYSDTDTLNYNKADRRFKAKNTVQNGDTTYFNLVLTQIPKSELNTIASVRGYVNIDGMFFYSPIVKRSYSQVANAVLEDEEIDDNIKQSVFSLLKKGV